MPAFPAAKLKLDEFFLRWLSENQDTVGSSNRPLVLSRFVIYVGPITTCLGLWAATNLHVTCLYQVTSLFEDVVAGRQLRTPATSGMLSASPLSPSMSHALFSSTVRHAHTFAFACTYAQPQAHAHVHRECACTAHAHHAAGPHAPRAYMVESMRGWVDRWAGGNHPRRERGERLEEVLASYPSLFKDYVAARR